MTDTNEQAETVELRLRLEEAEETIRAIRSGAVDAFVVEVPNGARVYTLETADRPYRLLVEEMQQGALTLRHDGTIAYCNRRFADLVGRPLERLVGIAFRDFAPLAAQDFFDRLLQQGRVGCSQGESHLQNADGALVPVFYTLNALPPDCGAAVGLLVTDLTTQHHHEKLNALLDALKEADDRKNEFLAMLAHELRSPLAPIANAVQLLALEQKSESPIQRKARNIIERQLGNLRHLVDDLLEVSRITTGRVQLRRELVAVNAIVTGAVESVRPLIEQRRHEITVALPTEPIWLHADAARLEQVMINLLTNAAKYSEEGGHVWLTVELEGDLVLIRVRDNGVGITSALLPRIFDLFTQAERSLDRSQGGLGIGLALVQRLTELHGGTVEAFSVLGQGSEFVVRFPRLKDERQTEGGDSGIPASSVTRPLRVLLVDDNVDTVWSFSMLLEACGHDVRTAHDGPTGVQAALDYQPDVALLDIGLPGLNGYEVAKRLRREPTLKNVVLVALTGYGQDTDRRASLQAGFNHHLVKPVRLEQLEQILATLSEERLAAHEGSTTVLCVS
jgi:PAS domain S-box-containing protein